MDNKIITKEKETLAMGFHTCLRKGVDSRGASIAWLAIDLFSPNIWDIFIDRLYRKTINLKNCLEAIQVTREDQYNGVHRTSDVILFEIGLEMMGDKELSMVDKYINKYVYNLEKD